MKHISLDADEYESVAIDDSGLEITLSDDAAAYLEEQMGR
jgi:hypothetical protein